MNRLSVCIITLNSEKYLSGVLDSVSFADEVVVLDSGSADQTEKICLEKKVRFISSEWFGFGKQKQLAVDYCGNDWVFVLDSDEFVTDSLREEIMSVLENPKNTAYLIPRLNYFFGKPVHHCGLYPDFSVRLFDRRKCHFSDSPVHERVITDCRPGFIRNHMLHFAYESPEEFITKQNRYSTLGKRKNRLKAIFNPFWTFFRIYFLKLGFLDGWNGFVISRLYSQYTFWKYIKD